MYTFEVTGVKNDKICIIINGFNFGNDGAVVRITDNCGCVRYENAFSSNTCTFLILEPSTK